MEKSILQLYSSPEEYSAKHVKASSFDKCKLETLLEFMTPRLWETTMWLLAIVFTNHNCFFRVITSSLDTKQLLLGFEFLGFSLLRCMVVKNRPDPHSRKLHTSNAYFLSCLEYKVSGVKVVCCFLEAPPSCPDFLVLGRHLPARGGSCEGSRYLLSQKLTQKLLLHYCFKRPC